MTKSHIWDAWCEDNPGKQALTPDEMCIVEACAAADAGWRRDSAGWGYGKPKTDLAQTIAKAIADSMERTPHAASAVRTLTDMTSAEVRALERQYGCKVKKR